MVLNSLLTYWIIIITHGVN